MKSLLGTALAIALLAAPASAERAAVAVLVEVSEARDFTERLILRGRTEADRRVEMRAEIAGLIVSEPLRKGSFVRAGDTLCRLADGERTAELAEARARLAEADLKFEAASQLSRKGFTAETTASAMVAELEQARARVLRAELNITRQEIRAPFDGILETDTAELGALLQSGSTCAALISLDPIKLIAYAPERSVDQLSVGAEVSARLITGRELAGRIAYVSRAADRDTRTYLIEAEAANADLAIRDGMTTEIAVQLEPRRAHLAPQSALTLDDEGVLGVRLNENGVARFHAVDILRDESGGVWLAGLPDRAEIIVVGQEFVTDGHELDVEYAEPGRIQ